MKKLYLNSFSFCSSVIVFTETWLKPSITNSEVLSSSYTIHRKDRSSHGGGILIAVNNSFYSEIVCFPHYVSQYEVEFIAIRMKFELKSFYITCSYIPPHSEVDIYYHHLEYIKFVSELLTEHDHMIVLGDFNLPNVNWIFDEIESSLHPSSTISWVCDFLDQLSDCGLCQINYFKNPFDNILDLVFVDTNSFSINRSSPLSLPEDIFHPTISISNMVESSTSFIHPQQSINAFN